MYCTSCGSEIKEGVTFCSQCGTKVGEGTPGKSSVNQAKRSSIFSFRIEKEELKYQVENYGKLSASQSYIGLSAALLYISAAITIVFVFTGFAPQASFIDAVLLMLLGLLVSSGKPWPFVVAMIFWTLEKFYQVGSGSGNIFLSLVWYYLYMTTFYKGYLVETARAHKK